MTSNVVVVESPAKAKTINKYLGRDFRVLASYGHIRDLPSKDGSVRPDDGFAMDWDVEPKAQRHIKEIAAAVKGAKRLYLATDPDREGEAISWHVEEVLRQRKALVGVDVKRVVFNEITKGAIEAAFAHPRELDRELVDAYLARRALDYLVGFTLSPVLWRKLPGSRSAGRVQSVALRLVCEREAEIEAFVARDYWTVAAELATAGGAAFTAQLTHLEGRKLEKFDLGDEAAAARAVAVVEAAALAVAAIERKQVRRFPAPPFTTSTLQQEAARKLGLGASRTMQVAQRLYEGVTIGGETVGLITYMRTDGVQMAAEAVHACRELIRAEHGGRYLPAQPRVYRSKAKNAQEAHEAIRPTDVHRRPADVAHHLDETQRRLYELIWKRTLASQMEAAVLDQVAVDAADPGRGVTLRATGSVVAFDGFFRLYREGRDDAPEDESDRLLPDLKEGEALTTRAVTREKHVTQPPPRYSEASLVKTLEEYGIGRPSTYASILSVLQERDYVRLEKRRFVPEDRGRLVTAFLAEFFTRYVDYNFTADLEDKLDEISGGRLDWKSVLEDFWAAFKEKVEETRELGVRQVLDALDRLLAPHFFRTEEARVCPSCKNGRLSLKLGKFGAFLGCSAYPECRYTRPLVVAGGDETAPVVGNGEPRALGLDPDSRAVVSLRTGPYGPYVQLGEAAGKGKGAVKPKRASLPRGMSQAEVDLDRALALLSLPRTLTKHPETGEPVIAGIGRFGPYIRHGAQYVSLKGDDDVLSIGANRALALLAEAPRKDPPRALGDHPADGKPVTQHKGRFGPYVQHGGERANLPRDMAADAVTLDQAVELIAAKAGRRAGGGTRRKAAPAKAARRRAGGTREKDE